MDINNSTQAAITTPTKTQSNCRIGLRCNSKKSFSDLLATIHQKNPNQSIQILRQVLSSTQSLGGGANG
jgi:hypothetical protein